jgi:uncharacterized membrane protein
VYLFLKLIHVVAVILFLGNIITGLFWHAHAAQTRRADLLAHTMAGIIRSDRIFTIPGVVVILGSGIYAAILAGLPLLRTGWIAWTLALFAASGLMFMFKVAPMQRQLHALASKGANGEFDFAAYQALAFRWEVWGSAALLTPLAGLVLMVLKPEL